MVVVNISKICYEKRLSMADVIKGTGIRPATIIMYWYGYIKRINVTDLDKLCNFIQCDIPDILKHISRPVIENEPGE